MDKKNSHGLIIFVKNPVLGKVKTRLARTIGDQAALAVYKNLMQHTRSTALAIDCNRHLFYDTAVNNNDDWPNDAFIKDVQFQGNLGERISHAMETVFKTNQSALIIGSDCPEINPNIINDALSRLEIADVVIGPTLDGGYYMIGMNVLDKTLFEDIPWSTEAVYNLTIEKIKKKGLTYTVMPTLSDMDNIDDLNKFPSFKVS